MLAVTLATMMPYRQVMTGQTDFATIRKEGTKTLKQGDSATLRLTEARLPKEPLGKNSAERLARPG
jgi:hypothetical protein